MKRHILIASIAALLPATPVRPHADPEHNEADGYGGNDIDSTEDMEAPDFGAIDEGALDSDNPAPTETPPVKTEVANPPVEEKPEGDLSKAAKAKDSEEEPVPDVTKTEPVEEKTEAKVEEKKADATKPAIPEDDSDLDAMQPARGAKPEQVKSFSAMKDIIKETRNEARTAAQRAKELEAEVEKLRTTATGAIPPEVQKELEELRAFQEVQLIEKSPVFAQKYEAPITQAEEGLYNYLKEQGCPEEILEEIKADGIDKWEGWNELLSHFKHPLRRSKAEKMIVDFGVAKEARDRAITELQGKRDQLSQEETKVREAEIHNWSRGIATEMSGLLKEEEWANLKDIPANATKEVKESIEAHNKMVKELGSESHQRIIGSYNRDPKVIAETVHRALRANILAKEVAEKDKSLTAAQARIKELEDMIASRRKAGSPSQANNGPRSTVTGAEDPKVSTPGDDMDLSADDAFDKWERQKNG